MKITVLWDDAPCSLAEVYLRFTGSCCFSHKCDEYATSEELVPQGRIMAGPMGKRVRSGSEQGSRLQKATAWPEESLTLGRFNQSRLSELLSVALFILVINY